MHLNGWQRLWVVGSVVLLGVIGYDTWQHLPTAKGIRAVAGEKAFLAQYEVVAGPDAIPPMDAPAHGFVPDSPKTQEEYDDCVAKAKSQASGHAWKCAPVVGVASAASAAKIRQDAEDRIRDRLFGQQAWRIGKGLLLWAAICAAVYAAGWALNWVRLGFKKPVA